jgi:hypothetical protein
MVWKTLRLFAPLAVLAGALICFAGEPREREAQAPRFIRVIGRASAWGAPDQAEIDIGVITQAKTAEAAATENAKRLDAVLAAIREALGSKGDVKTAGYTVHPDIRYSEKDPPTVTSYTATNLVHVKTSDLTGVGKIIDAAMGAGANNVQSLRFTLKDEQAVRAEAVREAVKKARAEAETIASTLGVKVVRVLSVDTSGPEIGFSPRPMALSASAEGARGGPTQIDPGTIELSASVTLTVEIGQ